MRRRRSASSRGTPIKAFHQQQKAARAAFRSQQPAPTPDQIKAFREQQHATVKAFGRRRTTVKAFRQTQLASVKACATNA